MTLSEKIEHNEDFDFKESDWIEVKDVKEFIKELKEDGLNDAEDERGKIMNDIKNPKVKNKFLRIKLYKIEEKINILKENRARINKLAGDELVK